MVCKCLTCAQKLKGSSLLYGHAAIVTEKDACEATLSTSGL